MNNKSDCLLIKLITSQTHGKIWVRRSRCMLIVRKWSLLGAEEIQQASHSCFLSVLEDYSHLGKSCQIAIWEKNEHWKSTLKMHKTALRFSISTQVNVSLKVSSGAFPVFSFWRFTIQGVTRFPSTDTHNAQGGKEARDPLDAAAGVSISYLFIQSAFRCHNTKRRNYTNMWVSVNHNSVK